MELIQSLRIPIKWVNGQFRHHEFHKASKLAVRTEKLAKHSWHTQLHLLHIIQNIHGLSHSGIRVSMGVSLYWGKGIFARMHGMVLVLHCQHSMVATGTSGDSAIQNLGSGRLIWLIFITFVRWNGPETHVTYLVPAWSMSGIISAISIKYSDPGSGVMSALDSQTYRKESGDMHYKQ